MGRGVDVLAGECAVLVIVDVVSFSTSVEALDLFTLADLLSRGPEGALFEKVIKWVRHRIGTRGGTG
jgi:hypothetical protein